MLKSFIAALAASLALGLSACASLPGFSQPCHVEGATKEETPKLCVIRGALTVKAAAAATAEQLQRDVITASEAEKIKAKIDEAAKAVDLAAAALPFGSGTLSERLVLLDQLVLDLLRSQAARD